MMATLHYFHDSLCGWCYGFIPALERVRTQLPQVTLQLHLGGLVTGARIGPYRAMRSYIEASVPRLEAVTGRRPGAAFMSGVLNSSMLASSVPPSSVLRQVLAVAPGRAIDVAHAIQVAHFEQGRDLNQRDVYEEIFRQLDLPFEVPRFDVRNADPGLQALFQATRDQGVSSFPTMHLEASGNRLPVAIDYSPSRLVTAVQQALDDLTAR